MDITWLEDFIALAHHRNFSRAAEARTVTQPAFSRRIRALEQWVGTQLCDRSTHSIKLTKAGLVFHAAAEESLRMLGDAKTLANEEAGNSEPMLRFAATHSLALAYFPNWVRSISKSIDLGSRIHLFADSTLGCEQMMITGQAQAFLAHTHPALASNLPHPQFRSVCIGLDELIPVSAPTTSNRPLFNLAAKGDKPIDYLSYGEPSGLGGILKLAHEQRQGQTRLRPVFTSHMASVLAKVAREKKGLAWLPKSLIEEELRNRSLVLAGPASWNVALEIRVFRPRSRQGKSFESFWRLISKTAKSDSLTVGRNRSGDR